MKNWIMQRKTAITLSVITLITELWRGFLDAMFVLPVDFSDRSLMELAALIFALLFTVWAWFLISAARGSRRGLIATFVLNGIVLLAIPVSWLFFYCPADCRAQAGVFNLANTLNLVFGLLAAVALGLQLRRSGESVVLSGETG